MNLNSVVSLGEIFCVFQLLTVTDFKCCKKYAQQRESIRKYGRGWTHFAGCIKRVGNAVAVYLLLRLWLKKTPVQEAIKYVSVPLLLVVSCISWLGVVTVCVLPCRGAVMA